jgi:hypothetical protein
MNIKTLSILAIVAALLVFAAVNLNQSRTGQGGAQMPPQLLFSDLAASLGEISEIRLQAQAGEVTLVKSADHRWQVKEKAGYRADLEKIGKLLMGAADLRYLEEKTRNPALYAQLDLQDINESGSQAVQVTLRDSNSNVRADFLVGKQKPARTDNTRQEIYVRKVNDSQTWLSLGNLPISYERKPEHWLQREVLDVMASRIQEVEVQINGDTVRIFKEADATDFSLADLPENALLTGQFHLNNIANGFAGLRLDDVEPVAEIDFTTPATAVMRTFDGLEITLETTPALDDGRRYSRLRAAYQAETDESAELEQEATQLNARFQDWAFVLPPFKLDSIFKTRADLIRPEVTPVDAPAHSGTME